MYVLILIISGWSYQSASIQKVDGFKTVKSCVDAGKFVQQSANQLRSGGSEMPSMKALCVKKE